MGKRKENKPQSLSEMTPDQLKALDIDTLIAMLMRVLEQNRQLSEILQQIVREKHGPKTEHFENPEQLRLFGSDSIDETTVSTNADSAAPSENSSLSPAPETKLNKKRKGHTRNPMPANLNRKTVTGNEPSQSDLTCTHCSQLLEKVSEVLRNSRYEFQPASVFIEDFVAMIFKCPGCGDTMTVEPPKQLIENGKAGPALLTEIVVAKFEDHMPLHRQEQRFARMGVPIARSTMVGWMKVTADRLRSLYDRMHELLLLSKVIATDDTPVKVQDRKLKRRLGKKLKIKIGRMWDLPRRRGASLQLVQLHRRARQRRSADISGWFHLLPPGRLLLWQSCFVAETGAIFVACLVHGRRYFIKALPNNKSACEEILQMFSDIFEIERTARDLGLSANQIKLMREQEAKPILEKMKTWLDQQVLTALPKSSFGKAVNYCLGNWTELTNYLP